MLIIVRPGMQQMTMPEYSAQYPDKVLPVDNKENNEEQNDESIEEAFVETDDEDYYVKTEL